MDNMDNSRHFVVSAYPARPASPWKVEVRASFAGRKIRRFCSTEAEAWAVGSELVEKIRSGGVEAAITKEAGMTMVSVTKVFRERQKGKSDSHRNKVKATCAALVSRFPLLCDATPSALDGWFAGLPGSDTTRAMVFRYVRMFFRWAVRMGHFERDPSAALDCPRAAVGRNVLSP
jgi:hypothetical protein